MRKFLLRSGMSCDVAKANLLKGEVGYNTDTEELVVGTGEGNHKVISKVYSNNGMLVADISDENGTLMPMCIKYGG